VSRPAVSQHLKVLLEAGLVNAKAEGTRRVYTVSSAGFLRLNIWLDQFWEALPGE
ncbi:MAG: helix-turn-helix transcriptional regulator, partial [Mesorhizobium sp.]